MSTTPNYELLKDAYAIIGGIPDEVFNLREIVRTVGKTLECGTIACAMGWLSMHPQFKALLKAEQNDIQITWHITSQPTLYYAPAAAALFGISESDASNLFTSRGGSEYDLRIFALSDKDVWLNRIKQFLRQHGQWRGLQVSTPC